jgi:chemotaxis protein MotB
MSRRKKAESHPNHERWLISYGDFITLMFALFVVLFASSQVDKRKSVAVAQAIQLAFEQMGVFDSGRGHAALERMKLVANTQQSLSAPPVPSLMIEHTVVAGPAYMKGELEGVRKKLLTALGVEIKEHHVYVRTTSQGLVVSLQEVGFFDTGSAVLKAGAMPVLARIANILAHTYQDIRVEGQTDNVPIHNAQFSSNWELSTARATEVLQLLITRFNIAPRRLSAAGFAKYHPVATNDTPQGRALNRRVDIVILRTDLSNLFAYPVSTAGYSRGTSDSIPANNLTHPQR